MPEITGKSSIEPVYILGAPSSLGGADTELWHTLRLWREQGLEVVIVPTWNIADQWKQKALRIGCTVAAPKGPEELLDVPGLCGSTVVSFCNGTFLNQTDRFRKAGCRLVWVNCMTWLFDAERKHYRQYGPFDHYVFQSHYQEKQLVPKLRKFGYREEQGSVVHGAFSLDEFPYRPLPHEAGTPFAVGRISRPDRDKYSSNTWPIYSRIPHAIQARLMAWDGRIEKKLGKPPRWAECLPANQETPREFFGKLHCMLQVNGGARENWPRSGLEAMASGVPMVVQNQWGWREMIRHGETGYLCDSDDELAYYTARLAYEEDLRLEITHRARRVLEEELAAPQRIWQTWQTLFERVARLKNATCAAIA